MAVTRITSTKDGRAAIRYALEEKSHKDGMKRVLASSGSNLDAKFAMMQMKAVWDSAGKNDGKSVQIYRIIQSFGLHELDPGNPEHVELANQMGLETVKDLYPDQQAVVVTQADGEGGKLHNHILVNAVSAIDGKSLRGNKTTKWKTVSDASDRVLGRHDIKPLVPDDKRPKSAIAETKIRESGGYVWKDDLSARIGDALYAPEVTDKDTFEQYMFDNHDVTVKYGKSNRVKYAFEDGEGQERDAGIKALGAPCGMENIQRAFERNEKLAQERLEQQRLEDEEKARQAIEAQPEILEVSSVPVFDLDAEMAKLKTRRKPFAVPVEKSKPVEIVENDLFREIQEEQKAETAAAKFNKMYDEALVEDSSVDDKRAEEADALKAKQEKEQKDAEAERQRIEAQRQAQIKEQAERALKAREAAVGRLRASMSIGRNDVVPPEVLERFMVYEKKLTGTLRNTPSGKTLHTTDSIFFKTKSDISDEKRAEKQGVQVATDQVAQADGPER